MFTILALSTRFSEFEQNWTSSFGVIFGSKTAYIYTGYLSSHALFCVRSCKETGRVDDRFFFTIVETPYLVSARIVYDG